jgi:sulfite reductase (NADPH) flavoprotein alpha-component
LCFQNSFNMDLYSVTLPYTSNRIKPFEKQLTILHASVTGVGEFVAIKASETARKKGFDLQLIPIREFNLETTSSLKNLLLVVSTHGNGAPPVSAEPFKRLLENRNTDLASLNFAVLALGDSSYPDFCQAGIVFDRLLEANGAKRISLIHLGDVDVVNTYPDWLTETLNHFVSDETVSVNDNEFRFLRNAKKKHKPQQSFLIATGKKNKPIENNLTVEIRVNKSPAETSAKKIPGPSNPYMSTVLKKVVLHGYGTERQTLHLELKTAGSGLIYQPGDSAGILPTNPKELVQEVLETIGLRGSEVVEFNQKTRPLTDFLSDSVELSKVTIDVVRRYKEFCMLKEFKELMENPVRLKQYLVGKDIVDLLTDFPTKELSAETLLGILRPLQPRLYSISSSPLETPDELHLTIGVSAFEQRGKTRKGVCTTYISSKTAQNESIPLFIKPNPAFRLPNDPGIPVIMIGAGTGIAPYRSFVQHRAHSGQSGKSWLFFGNRNQKTEFLYRDEWTKHLKNGSLTRMDVAFSRDGGSRKYVQHCLQEHAGELFDWLENGCYLYLCGDREKMAGDVQNSLVQIFSRQGKQTVEEAQSYLEGLQLSGRFQMDVY